MTVGILLTNRYFRHKLHLSGLLPRQASHHQSIVDAKLNLLRHSGTRPRHSGHVQNSRFIKGNMKIVIY